MVHAAPARPNVSGILILEGQKTVAILSGDELHRYKSNNGGWFDVWLKAGNGDSILLHNALYSQTRSFSAKGSKYEEHIFPNIVILGADKLTKSGRIEAISFQVDRLKYFFYYQYIECHYLYNQKAENIATLRKFRRDRKREYDFFRPSSLYIGHTPLHAIRFRLEGRIYQIGTILSSNGLGWDHVKMRAEPVARITFDKSVTVDEALDHVWAWNRFFSQLAMEPLEPKAITARAKRSLRRGEAKFYLPNLVGEIKDKGQGFSPGELPLNRWCSRKELSNVMGTWLSKSKDRNLFRALVGGVIKNRARYISIDDIMLLCSAIESLEEFNQTSTPSDEIIKEMTNAATNAAKTAGHEVDRARIKGLLGLLQHTSLPNKLKRLMKTVGTLFDNKDREMLIGSVIELRRQSAHGQIAPKINMSKVGATVMALAAICALYDLMSCGVPLKSETNEDIWPLKVAKGALADLKAISM